MGGSEEANRGLGHSKRVINGGWMMSVEQTRLWWFGCFGCAHGADRDPTAHGSLLSYRNKDHWTERFLLASLVKCVTFMCGGALICV